MTRAASKKTSVCIEQNVEKQIKTASYRFIYAMKLPLCETDDVAQELRISIERSKMKYDSGIGNFESFVCGVIKNKIKSMRKFMLRDKRSIIRTDYLEDIANKFELGQIERLPEFLIYEDKQYEDFSEIDKIIKKLPKKLASVCTLLSEYNPSEISKILGISRGSVRYRIEKIRKIFSDELANLKDDGII